MKVHLVSYCILVLWCGIYALYIGLVKLIDVDQLERKERERVKVEYYLLLGVGAVYILWGLALLIFLPLPEHPVKTLLSDLFEYRLVFISIFVGSAIRLMFSPEEEYKRLKKWHIKVPDDFEVFETELIKRIVFYVVTSLILALSPFYMPYIP